MNAENVVDALAAGSCKWIWDESLIKDEHFKLENNGLTFIKPKNSSWQVMFGNQQFEKGLHRWDWVIEKSTHKDGIAWGIVDQ